MEAMVRWHYLRVHPKRSTGGSCPAVFLFSLPCFATECANYMHVLVILHVFFDLLQLVKHSVLEGKLCYFERISLQIATCPWLN